MVPIVLVERTKVFVPKLGPIWHQFQSTGSHYNGKKRRGQRQTGPVVLLPVFCAPSDPPIPTCVFVTQGDCSPQLLETKGELL